MGYIYICVVTDYSQCGLKTQNHRIKIRSGGILTPWTIRTPKNVFLFSGGVLLSWRWFKLLIFLVYKLKIYDVARGIFINKGPVRVYSK